MSHDLSSETGMPVSCLLALVEENVELSEKVSWRGLSESDDTLQPNQKVYKDAPRIFDLLLNLHNTNLKTHAVAELGL